MERHELPEGWEWIRLGDSRYFDLIMGQSPPSSTYNLDGTGLPFFQGKAEFGELHPIANKYCSAPTRVALKDDVLISVRAPVGPTNLADRECCIGRGLAAIRCNGKVLPRYVLYAIRNIEHDIAATVQDQGGGFTAIKREQLANVEILVPLLAEQQRIVTRINELIRRVEEARRLRWVAVEENSNLFQEGLRKIFSEEETENFPLYNARMLFTAVSGQVDPQQEPYTSIPHVGPDNIESGTGRLLDGLCSAGDLGLRSGKYLFGPEHVLYSKIRPALRKVCLPSFTGVCSADMYPLLPNPELITREFLALSLLAPPFTKYAVDNSERNAMPKINRTVLFSYEMRVPDKETQQQIVEYLFGLQSKAEELKLLQIETEAELTAFTPALLTKAFRGEL